MAVTKTTQTYTDTANTGQATFTAASTAVGNCVVVCTFVASSTVNITGISGTGFTWVQAGTGFVGGSGVPGGSSYLQIWLGTVTSVQSTAVTCTATFSASNSALYTGFMPVGEFTAGSTATTWAVDGTQTLGQTNTAATGVKFGTLSAAGTGELYIGNGTIGSGGSPSASGTGTGITFLVSTQGVQPYCYGVLAASGSTGTINQTDTTSQQSATYSALLIASGGTATPSGSDSGSGGNSATISANPSITDSGAGGDAGGITIGFTGTDSGTGTEAYLISTPVVGNEPGSGTEVTAQVAATTAGGDSGTGSDTVSGAAATAGQDTAIGAESGTIRIAASDTAVGSEAQSSTAQVAGTNPGTGSEGGFYDTAFGDLNLSLWAVDPSTGALSPLPDYTQLTVSPQRNAPGAITVVYPADGINYNLLHNNVTADRDLEVEIWLSGSQTGRLRGYLTDTAIDDTAEPVVASLSGSFLELRMSEALVFPQAVGSANGNTKQEAVFNAATAGGVMGTLLTQAQARGALTDITKDFTSTADSRGVAWPTVVTTKFSPMTTYQSVLDTLVSLGLCEWAITADHVLHLWVSGGRGTDRTTGPKPVILRRGRNITAAPRKHSVRASATAVLAAGSEGLYAPVSDAGAQSRRGRRVEVSSSANNLTDLGAVQAFAGTELVAVSPGAMEITHGLGFLPGEPRPGTVFDVGDWIYSDTGNGLERRRVAQWTLTVGGSAGATPSGTVTLNDLTTDAVSALQAQIRRATNGSAVVGTSTSTVDNGIPTPPTGVVASSTAYMVGGQVYASVTVGWAPPSNNVDGSVITDLAGFSVQYAVGTGPSQSAGTISNGSATSFSFTTAPKQTIHIQVRAFDQSGNASAWSSPATDHITAYDVTAPPATSTPVVSNYLGVLKIAWDGLTSTGGGMVAAAPDFDHVEVHISPASGFTPSTSTYFDRLYAAGTVVYTDGVYGTTYYAKLVPVDGSSNAGVASAQGSDTPTQVVSLDVFDGAIGTAKLADAAITTAKINDLAVNNAKIGDLSVGKLTAGILSVAVTLSGIIRTATTGARSEIDAAGIRLYNTGGTNTVNLNAADGSVLVTGQYQTALSGQRLVLNPGGGTPDTINVYPSGGGDYARVMSRTAPSDGSAAVLIDGGAASGYGRGRLGAYKGEAFVSWVTSDSGGDTSSGYSQTAVSCASSVINMWAQSQIRFDRYNGSTYVADGHTYLVWTVGSGSSYCPTLTANAPGVNAGVKFDSGIVSATINEGTAFGSMKATAFTVASTGASKTDVVDIATVLPPLDTIRAAKSKAWKYKDDVTHHGAKARTRFGPIAEDLPASLVVLTPPAAGGALEPSISLGDQIGVLWAAVAQLADAVDALSGKPPKPAGAKP